MYFLNQTLEILIAIMKKFDINELLKQNLYIERRLR